ncbi:MAG: metal ABC transporter ATP-binding protein [Microthrixaceae bacterium]
MSTVVVDARDLVLAHEDHIAIATSSLQLWAGSIVAIIGPNGSGKSTLLDAVTGLLAPRAGTLEVLGSAPGRGSVAYVLQSTDTPAHLPLTVREVVTMGRYRSAGLVRRIGAHGRAAIERAMERTDVAAFADRQLLELSGGQRQRVLVAQGLASEADLLVLDEPMTGLDVVSRQGILEVMGEERDAGRTVLYSTHDLAEAADADQVVLLAGRVVAMGTPDEVLTDEHLVEAYRGRLIDVGGVRLIDDPHHHGDRADRHDGHHHH